MTSVQLTGEAIQLGRAMRKMTQRELAVAARVKPWRLQAIERNKVLARPRELEKILRVLTIGE